MITILNVCVGMLLAFDIATHAMRALVSPRDLAQARHARVQHDLAILDESDDTRVIYGVHVVLNLAMMAAYAWLFVLLLRCWR